MKTNFLKIGFLTLAAAAFAMTSLTSCKDDETENELVKDRIVGTWDFVSFKLDGDEYMGTIVDSSTITFKAYTAAQGDFDHDIVYADGEREELKGKYSVNETKKELVMIAGQQRDTIKLSFPNADKMEWVGKQDGEPLVAKAERQ